MFDGDQWAVGPKGAAYGSGFAPCVSAWFVSMHFFTCRVRCAASIAPAVTACDHRRPTGRAARSDAHVTARLQHQPALDGLRGIAVIAVVIFHQPFNPSWLKGGFLGVDIFFVLSGYLITALLLVDFDRTGRVVSAQFWARRARRLLPALGVFLLLVAVYSVFFAQPYERGPIRQGGFAVIAYVYNWWRSLYATRPPSIYNHLWSLSIEEQFYVAWPVMLAGLLYWRRGRRVWLGGGMAGLIGASIAIMHWRYYRFSASVAYEATDARVRIAC